MVQQQDLPNNKARIELTEEEATFFRQLLVRCTNPKYGQAYIARAFFQLTPISAPGLKTMGIDKFWRVYIDFDYLMPKGIVYASGYLAHEPWHELLNHTDRGDAFKLPKGVSIPPKTWGLMKNIAGDLEINDDIRNLIPPTLLMPSSGTFRKYPLDNTMEQHLTRMIQEPGVVEDFIDPPKQTPEEPQPEKNEDKKGNEEDSDSQEEQKPSEKGSKDDENDAEEKPSDSEEKEASDKVDESESDENNSEQDSENDSESSSEETSESEENKDSDDASEKGDDAESDSDDAGQGASSEEDSEKSDGQSEASGGEESSEDSDGEKGSGESANDSTSGGESQDESSDSDSSGSEGSGDNGEGQPSASQPKSSGSKQEEDNSSADPSNSQNQPDTEDSLTKQGESRYVQCGPGAGNDEGDIEDYLLPENVEGVEQVDESEANIIRQQVAEDIREYKKKHGVGSVPGSADKWAEDVLERKSPDWRSVLRSMVKAAISWKRGQTDYVMSRPNRRQPLKGFILPALKSPKPTIGIAIDKSGSNVDQLATIIDEIADILKSVGVRGQEVKAFAVDVRADKARVVNNPQDVLKDSKVGGGTRMTPGYVKLAELGQDINLLFTDGEVYDFPTKRPKGKKTSAKYITVCLVPDTAAGHRVIEMAEKNLKSWGQVLPIFVEGRTKRKW